MSLALKIDKYRTAKRIAAEARHLHSRLVNNCLLDTPSQQTDYPSINRLSQGALLRSTILRTRPVDEKGKRFESAFCFRIHERCSLLAAVNTDELKDAAELAAVTEALRIIPTSTEWGRILKVFDSDLFVAFIRLLKCLNGAAAVEISRKVPPRPSNDDLGYSSRVDMISQVFKATVSVELASIDEMDLQSVSRGDQLTPASASNADASSSNENAWRETRQRMPLHYDFGVSGDWAFSVRDAIKLAIANSFDVLENHVIEEWREVGKEAALLLNELRLGGSSTSELDTGHLNSALTSHSFPARVIDNVGECGDEMLVRWTVRSQQKRSDVRISPSRSEQNDSTELGESGENSFPTSVEIIGAQRTTGLDDAGKTQTVTEYTVCAFPVALPRRRNKNSFYVNGVGVKHIRDQMLWQQRCLPGAMLMSTAVQRRALYRHYDPHFSKAQLYDLSRKTAKGSHLTARNCVRTPSEFTRNFLPLFAALSCSVPSALSASTSESNDKTAASRSNGALLHSAASSQNVWYCPDVVVMLAIIRSTLRLSHDSFPEVKFDQKAVHDPVRRVRELTMGLYGDVDVYTKVRVEWATPRGTFVASAESDPARHSTSNTCRSSPSQWLSCEDTGHPRGPLPLLVAAVCSLFDQVMASRPSALQHYPVIPVKEPFLRRGLDFLFYSWFGATPQVRCFAIGTAAPMAEVKAGAGLRWRSPPDGFTSSDVGAYMTRAMLFYDFLGQRVLFAETHASDVVDAVARLDALAMEVNHIHQDVPMPVSAARGRPLRSISHWQQWRVAREHLERAVKSLAAPAASTTSSAMGMSVAATSPAPSSLMLQHLLRCCIDSCANEVSALWTVVDVLARVALPTPLRSASSTGVVDNSSADVLTVHYTPDSSSTEERAGGVAAAVADRIGGDEEELLWLGRRHVPWRSRPLGKETAPPPAGVVELRLDTQAFTFSGSACTASKESARSVSFRCRVDPLCSSDSSCDGGDGSAGQAFTGVLPALTVLCRAALRYVWAKVNESCHAIANQLPSIEELLGWCMTADPVLAREADGFPPFEARFYAAPKLLGELLQGIAGKYSCSYSAVLPNANSADTTTKGGCPKVDIDALSAPASFTATLVQPSTVFYRSEVLLVNPHNTGVEEAEDDGGPWSASSRHAAAQSAPPCVECTLFIDGIMRSCNNSISHRPYLPSSFGSPAASSKPVTTTAGYVLGRGVGRTKREAWRSAAWQALRLQFPLALAQMEVLRDVTELTQHPDQLSLLSQRKNDGSTVAIPSTAQQRELLLPALPVCGLRWQWRQTVRSPHGSHPSVTSCHRDQSTLPITFVCSVDLLYADDAQTPLPGVTATATSAGEAYVLAGKKLLQLVGEARLKKHASGLPSPSFSDSAWGLTAVGWTAASSSTLTAATASESSRQLPYANWRLSTHFTKSIWHAYAGALSVYFGEDMIVELLRDMRDEQVEDGDKRQAELPASARAFHNLSTIQVRSRYEGGYQPAAYHAAGSRAAGCWGDGGDGSLKREHARRVDTDDVRASSSSSSSCLRFRQTPASLLARHPPRRPSPQPPSPPPSFPSAQQTATTSTPSLSLAGENQPFTILRATSWWLRDLVEQCAMLRQTREELNGLLRGRLHDIERIQRTSRWSPAERVAAMVQRWTGCHAEVRLRGSAFPSSSSASSPADSMWVAEVLLRICVVRLGRSSRNRRRDGQLPQGKRPETGRMFWARQPGVWVVGRAAAATSDEAAWRLYCDVCEAVREAAP
ncbi:hypothetical protein ABB37_07884 [Leptomonas pyrrhocoris]|uniref:Uncharacterized protein n=1 Tax=Leptomonas pyrrhocoris TaxID=157538 RepID=A0A0N0DSI1_LEPPY|nr:hypothetical protein ABB37_07884 [Leptomonas pyrrhocoris]KPA76112.1 hypothetical protein ABB37_07884 [Leptomonas pyrrhocoris]|eukprot:XP_015654551.1 hypothetical protein ABB37_07884 [Leptomonas pyrrhocoris]